MKKSFRLLAGTVWWLVPAALTAQMLTYVESSGGLQQPALDGGPTEVEMGDVNGDGNVDLVSIGDHGSPYINTDEHGVMVWLGDGRGGWQVVQYGTFGYGGVALGDANGDGRVDVGYGMHHNYSGEDLGDQLLEVALGDGSGRRWLPWDDGLATDGETYGMSGTDFADFDGDGDLDLAGISFGCCSGVHVYLNQGDGSWVPSFGFLGGNSNEQIATGDVNGDGRADLAVGHGAGTVYVGNGQGGFALADGNLPFGPMRKGIALGDVDGDGSDDLAWVTGAGAPQVWGLGSGGAWRNLGAGLPASGPWQAAQLWDMDGDSRVDLAAFGEGRFALWRGDGAGGWTPMASFTTPSPGTYTALRVGGDADHNGRPDVALVAEEGGGFNTFNTLRFFRESTPPTQLAVRLVHPAAGATLRAGSVRFIDWAAEVPGAVPSKAALAYRVDGGPWQKIAIGIPNNGRYQWVVPQVAGSELRLGVAVATATGRAMAMGPLLHLVGGAAD